MMILMNLPTTIPPPVQLALPTVLFPQHLLTESSSFTQPPPAPEVVSLIEDFFAHAAYPHDGINE